ncbi:Fpg/Nei family DNA glycosylase [Herbiconiux moechotypicola]|uniref:DNA-(apurinic or apyrimidinic site) lyase n=1 Tax=Herbiconiux moechotypicola TaxID=637393 RepID=A0ABP5QDJ3_9MICO|nr:DNA-formamidopyrimidine glycosylase family protein [Herbiconiux moechotypicola]MCS5729816.1 Fpg/Nei family DNA glycosylase [Herbiconiux moechotypicola]
MPEGHSVHRIARQFARNFVGRTVSASSPQGRFAEGASLLDGHVMTASRAVGKQMFLEFDDGLWLRVHLGIYGAWDFAGEITADATIRSAGGRMGQTNQRGTAADARGAADAGVTSSPRVAADTLGRQAEGTIDELAIDDADGEDSIRSIGAPRRSRLRMSEQEKEGDELDEFPPPPIGAVRVRLLTDTAVADLRGPTACEVLTSAQVDAVIAKLGPDPLLDDSAAAEQRFVDAVRKKQTPIALLLMDQSVVSGIGNVYRAEMLFRARLNPHTPGKQVSEETARALWRDWAYLLDLGVRTGQMMTMDDLSDEDWVAAMASRADRHWVYKREGLPCRVCGTHIVLEEIGGRKLYWCPKDQA